MSKYVLAAISDVHAGSLVSVCPPQEFRGDDGTYYRAGPHQVWAYEHWQKYWDRVAEVKAQEGGDFGILSNGDMVEGDHHNTPQIFSRNLNIQSDIVEALFVPVFDRLQPDHIFVVRGTEAHVGKNAAKEESISKGWYKAGYPVQLDPSNGTHSWWHFRGDLGETRVDFTHHGRTGYRPWTDQNAANLLAWQIFSEHSRDEHQPPKLAIRSHFHRCFDSYDAAPVRVIQTPCWQLNSAHAKKVVAESLPHIGGIIVVFEDGQITRVEKMVAKPDRGPIWRP